jgi:hypothetical protein
MKKMLYDHQKNMPWQYSIFLKASSSGTAADRIEFLNFSGLCKQIFAHLPHLVKSGNILGDEYSTEPVPFSQLCELDSLKNGYQ